MAHLPRNQSYDINLHRDEKVAIQFVEGWAVRRIAFAAVTFLLLGVLATLLWVTVGRSGGEQGQLSSGDVTGDGKGGYTTITGGTGVGMSGRVEGGVLLGLLVLLVGWTGVGAWVWLSWLVG